MLPPPFYLPPPLSKVKPFSQPHSHIYIYICRFVFVYSIYTNQLRYYIDIIYVTNN